MKSRHILALGGAATLAYALVEPWRIEVRRFDVFLENLPEKAVGTRVLQISDLHAGAIMPVALLQRIIRLAAREEADIIALTGDLVSRRDSYSRFSIPRYTARPIMEYAQSVARELEILRPKLGIFAVPGNHDLWNGSFAPIEEVLAKSDITTLLNRSIRLENGLILAGLDDLRAGIPDLRATFADVDFEESQIILNHNPRLAMLLSSRNALILSGHTHAGQVRLPGLRLRKFPVDLNESFYIDGFYRTGKAQLYVSRGVGTVHFPLRFNARPEIVVFTLKMAPKAAIQLRATPIHSSATSIRWESGQKADSRAT